MKDYDKNKEYLTKKNTVTLVIFIDGNFHKNCQQVVQKKYWFNGELKMASISKNFIKVSSQFHKDFTKIYTENADQKS